MNRYTAAAAGDVGGGGGAPEGAAEDSTKMSREERAKAREARVKAREARPKPKGDKSRSWDQHQSRERSATERVQEGLGVGSKDRGTSRDRCSKRGGGRGSRGGGGGFSFPKLKLPSLSSPNLGALGDVLKGLVKELSPCGMLAAAAGIFLVGNFSKIRGPPQYYEVQEGDSLCTIAGCYNKEWSELLDKNADTIDDPNVIYPGDRIRLS